MFVISKTPGPLGVVTARLVYYRCYLNWCVSVNITAHRSQH
jgi:hypothetical protein